MTRIGLISDTHGWLDEKVFVHFKDCDEIWHAGDFGNAELSANLAKQSGLNVRGVFGNIDGNDIRSIYPEQLLWTCEEVKIFMKHIGGHPGRYAPGVKDLIQKEKPQLFISGHSHILKVIYDEKLSCLHFNPGAAGRQGWQLVRTIITFAIDRKNILDCKVIELGRRGG